MFPNIRYRQIQIGASFAFVLLLLPLASVVWAEEEPIDVTVKPVPTSAAHRVSERLDITPENVNEVMDRRAELLARSVNIQFIDTSSAGRNPPSVQLSLASHPGWLRFDERSSSFVVDARAIRQYVDEHQSEFLQSVIHAGAVSKAAGHTAISIEGNPQAGYRIDPFTVAEAIVHAFENNEESITLDAEYQEPVLFLMTASGVLQLPLLSRGESDFTGSPIGRAANVRKALNEHLNGLVIQPGEEFSFNATMANTSGWKDALVIKSGGALVSEPGGGICQSTTTLYRAVLMAGLPILKRANHSLYVTYYEKLGVGLDATVYAPKQDFVFKNDTSSPIVMIAHGGETQAYVELYGASDGRTVKLDGPFFASDSSESESFKDKPLRINQIGWEYVVTYADGRVIDDPVISTYKAIPKKLKEEFARKDTVITQNIE